MKNRRPKPTCPHCGKTYSFMSKDACAAKGGWIGYQVYGGQLGGPFSWRAEATRVVEQPCNPAPEYVTTGHSIDRDDKRQWVIRPRLLTSKGVVYATKREAMSAARKMPKAF